MDDYNCQQVLKAKCFHPSGSFVQFSKEKVEQSVPDRFEQQVAKYPDRIAVKTKNFSLTYDALNKTANRLAHAMLAFHRNDAMSFRCSRSLKLNGAWEPPLGRS